MSIVRIAKHYRSKAAPAEHVGGFTVTVRGIRKVTRVHVTVDRAHRLDRLGS